LALGSWLKRPQGATYRRVCDPADWVWDWVWVWVAPGWPLGGPSVAQGSIYESALFATKGGKRGGWGRNRRHREGKSSPRRRGDAENTKDWRSERGVKMGIPGVESYKTFRILVEVEGGGVPLRSGDPMIGKSGDRKT
jgi:hypothetical protein